MSIKKQKCSVDCQRSIRVGRDFLPGGRITGRLCCSEECARRLSLAREPSTTENSPRCRQGAVK